MIRAHYVRVDLDRADPWHETLAHKEIIDAPTDIPRSGVGKVSPPGVMATAFCKKSESIHESGSNERIDAFPFLFGKTMLAFIGIWVRQIIRRVRYIQVATENNRLSLLKMLQKGQKRWVPELVTKRKTAQIGLRIRGIHIDHPKVFEFS